MMDVHRAGAQPAGVWTVAADITEAEYQRDVAVLRTFPLADDGHTWTSDAGAVWTYHTLRRPVATDTVEE